MSGNNAKRLQGGAFYPTFPRHIADFCAYAVKFFLVLVFTFFDKYDIIPRNAAFSVLFFLVFCIKGRIIFGGLMKKERVFYCEAAYVVGIILLALGTALMERSDFGLSMIVAPAYLIHLKVSELLPWFSFGISEILFQSFLLVVLSIFMGRIKKSYILSIGTALLYGVLLDLMMLVVSAVPFNGIAWRIICYALGLLICTFAIAMLFHTYLPLEAYEEFVKGISAKTGFKLNRVKIVYDISSLVLAIALTLIFFGGFVGVRWGTLLSTALNGWLIGIFINLLDKLFVFRDAFPLRNKF